MDRRHVELATAVALAIGCGLIWMQIGEIRHPKYIETSPALWLKVTATGLTVLTGLYLLRSVNALIGQQAPAEGSRPKGWFVNPLISVSLFAAFLLLIPYLGMLVAGILFVFGLLTGIGNRTPRALLLHAVVALCVVGGMWALFTYQFGIILPDGDWLRI